MPPEHPSLPADRGRTDNDFYIMATSSQADDQTMVLKHGETFAVFDRGGDIQSVGRSEQGLYHAGTRFLSRQELRLENTRPLLLHAAIQAENALLTIDLTNPDIAVRAERFLAARYVAYLAFQVSLAGTLLRTY